MLLTLSVNALLGKLRPPGNARPSLTLNDVPAYVRGEFGLSGLAVPTSLLAGADRPVLTKLLEAADKASCPCLVLMEHTPQRLASPDPKVVQAAQDRCLRVAQAAAWLGCSAFSIPVEARTEEHLAAAAGNLRSVSRRAEKLELNLCVQPSDGITAAPERVTELLKKIGGFRVGTLPDLGAAVAFGDASTYLRRLAPYASTILVPAGPADAPRAPVRRPAVAAVGADAPAKPKGKGKGASKTKAKAAEPDPVDPAVGVPAPAAAEPGEPAAPVSLESLVAVLLAVGYDGPLALEYRGPLGEDPAPAILRTRDTMMRALGIPQTGALEVEDDTIPDLPPDEEEGETEA